jgi:uncharacterized membrane protein
MTKTEETASVVETPAQQTNTMALIGFILSLAGFVVGITAIPGIVLGHIGLHQIKRTGEQGHGLGVAALIIGYIQVGLWFLAAVAGIIFLIIVAIAAANHNGGMYYNDMMMN